MDHRKSNPYPPHQTAYDATPKAPTKNNGGAKTAAKKKRTAAVLNTQLDSTPADPSLGESNGGALMVDGDHRVRVDRAGHSPEDRKRMDEYIYQVTFSRGVWYVTTRR